MTSIKQGKRGKLIIELSYEQRREFAIEKERLKKEKENAKILADEKKKQKELDKLNKKKMEFKEVEDKLLKTITDNLEIKNNETDDIIFIESKKDTDIKISDKKKREGISPFVEKITWPFDGDILTKNYRKYSCREYIFRYPGQMIIHKCLLISTGNYSLFREFFSPTDSEQHMLNPMLEDSLKIILYNETGDYFMVPDFVECFTSNTDLLYSDQQKKLKEVFVTKKIPPVVTFNEYFTTQSKIKPISSFLEDTGDENIYKFGEIYLKPEQKVILDMVYKYLSDGNKRLLLNLGTGVGKTFTALFIAKMINTKSKIAIVANTTKQISYWISEIKKVFPNEIAVSYNETPKTFKKKLLNAKFVIFSQQCISYTQDKIFENYKYTQQEADDLNHDDWFDQFSIVLVDECHEMVSKTRRPFITNFTNSYIIGLSATPDAKETTRRITFLYYGNIISNSKVLKYASKNNIVLHPSKREYETIFKIVNYTAKSIYTEVDECSRGRIAQRKEKVPLPQCLIAKSNSDIHRIYMLAHLVLETSLEGRCTILLCRTVDYLYMIKDAIQRLIKGKSILMLHNPEKVVEYSNKAIEYPEYLENVITNNLGYCIGGLTFTHRKHEVLEINSENIGKQKEETDILLGTDKSYKRYGHLANDPLYNNPLIICSKYKVEHSEETLEDAIEMTNIILSTDKSLGTGFNIKKANTVIMAHPIIAGYEQCIGRMHRDLVGMDRHGYDIVDKGCNVFKSQYAKRCKKYYNNISCKREVHFYEACDIILDNLKEVKVPNHLINYKTTIDTVPQAEKMKLLKEKKKEITMNKELVELIGDPKESRKTKTSTKNKKSKKTQNIISSDEEENIKSVDDSELEDILDELCDFE